MKTLIKRRVGLVAVALFAANVAFAGQARIMSDFELDQIHAGGLNLDFGTSLGNAASTSDTITRGGLADLSSGARKTFNFSTGSVKVFNIPKTPTAPTQPKAPDLSSLQVSSTAQEASAAAVAVTSDALVSTDVQDVAGLEVTAPEVTAPAVTEGTSAETAPAETARVAAVAEPTAVSAVAAVETPQPSVSTNAVTTAAPDDVMVLVDTPGGRQMGVVIDGSTLSALQQGRNGDVNILNVTDTAQQFLQALANVNAVNSTVPVQINMVVLVDSVVQNLNNSNTLNIESTGAVQF